MKHPQTLGLILILFAILVASFSCIVWLAEKFNRNPLHWVAALTVIFSMAFGAALFFKIL